MKRSTALILLCLLTLLFPLGTLQTPVQAATAQNLTVDATTVLNRIEYPFWGVNYVGFWDTIQGSNASRQAIKNAGIQLLRFPGGEPANWLDLSKPDAPPYWTNTSVKKLQAYAQGVGARLLLQTNPTNNRLTDPENGGELNNPSGEHAAENLRYVQQQGADVPYWEIGNEPDMHIPQDQDWNRAGLDWYFSAFNEQAKAMKAVNPNIKVFGPVGTNAWQWWGLHSLDMFLERTGNRKGSGLADGVSLHYYGFSGCTSWDQVREVAQDWPRHMDHIKEVIATYDTRPLPVFISETNAAVGGMNCEINQTMASALANADLFGAYRATGVQAMQAFGAIHGANAWGLLYGSNEGRAADSATPTYYVLPIWTRTGNEVLKVTGATDPKTTLSAYASRQSDGSIQVVAINKSDSATPLNLSFNGFSPAGGTVSIYELRPANGGIWDKDVLYNGVRTPDPGAPNLPEPTSQPVTGANFTRSLPAYSMTLLNFSPGGPRISGRVTDPTGAPLAGVTLTLAPGQTTVTGANGSYTMPQPEAGTYVLTPSLSGYIFAPRSRKITIPTTQRVYNFTGVKPKPKGATMLLSDSYSQIGSQVALICANFPPSQSLHLSANTHSVGQVNSDESGSCDVTITTSDADKGYYKLTLSTDAEDTSSASIASVAANSTDPLTPNPEVAATTSASALLMLSPNAPPSNLESDMPLLALPGGIAQLMQVYLPLLRR